MQRGSGKTYTYSPAVHSDFQSLLDDRPEQTLSCEAVAALAFARGRLLLQARAGAGKSTTLRRILEASEHPARLIDLRVAAASGVIAESPIAAEAWLRELLDDARATNPKRGGRVLFGLDGLDGLSTVAADLLVAAIEEVTRSEPDFAVVLVDRLARRELRLDRWCLLGLTGVSERDLTPWRDGSLDLDPKDWMRLPLYLDLAQRTRAAPTPGGVFTAAFVAAVGEERILDELALKTLRKSSSPWSGELTAELLRGIDVGDVEARFLEAGLATRDDESDTVRFGHSLVRGYLAARALASRPREWSPRMLDNLTFGGSTLEVLGLLLDQVPDKDVDRLVRAVDNWNFYATAYLLTEDFASSVRISPELRSAVLLSLGLRRFAQLPATRQKVEDALRVHGGDLAEEVLGAGGVLDLVDLARSQAFKATGWWGDWLDAYASQAGNVLGEKDLEAILSPDSVIGWTAANALVGRPFTVNQRERLFRVASTSADPNARWRAAHIIGGFGDEETARRCLALFREDPSDWVRYGALRSFFSVCSRVPERDVRTRLLLDLATDAKSLARSERWKRNIEESVEVDAPPVGWMESVGALLERLWAEATSVDEQDRWRIVSARLRESMHQDHGRLR